MINIVGIIVDNNKSGRQIPQKVAASDLRKLAVWPRKSRCLGQFLHQNSLSLMLQQSIKDLRAFSRHLNYPSIMVLQKRCKWCFKQGMKEENYYFTSVLGNTLNSSTCFKNTFLYAAAFVITKRIKKIKGKS